MSTRRPPRPPGGRPQRRPGPPRPQDRPAPAVYWRRRAMVGGTLVLLVVATVNLFNGGDPEPTGETAQQVVGTPTVAPGTDDAATGKGKGRKRGATPPPPTVDAPPGGATAETPDLAEPEGRCEDSDVAVTPVMEPAVAGRPVLVTLTLRTLESRACTWTIGRDHLAYKITADGEDVWSSSHCPREVPEGSIVVRRSSTATYRLAWDGRTSSRDCPGGADYAAPGEYQVQAAAIGGEPSPQVTFTLADPDDVFVPDGPLGPTVPETKQDKNKQDKNKQDKNKQDKNKNKPGRR